MLAAAPRLDEWFVESAAGYRVSDVNYVIIITSNVLRYHR